MREMKDSGLPWAGEIPINWKIMPIKYLKANVVNAFVDGPFGSNLKSQHYVDDGDVYVIESGFISTGVFIYKEFKTITNEHFATINRSECKAGDVIIAKIGANFGMAGELPVLDKPSVVSGNSLKITLEQQRILNYLFVREMEIAKYNGGFISIVNETAQPALSLSSLNNFRLIIPPFEEQLKIEQFLMKKCAEIDALSADIQSEIETLEAYKRSIITEAVTKGLDKNEPMKESGIEWVGRIPTTWTMVRGKYAFEQKSDRGNTKSLVLLSPTQNYGVIPQDLYEELSGFSAVKLNEKTDYNSLKTVHKGAFVISLRSFQGGFEYSEYEGVVSPAYQVFYPTIPVCDGYYKYLFKTQIFIDKMNSYTMSLRDGKNIAFADFGRTYIPVPPVSEQIKIAKFLDDKCDVIRDTIAQKQEQLSILADYKKSVIYEYVTGKKEVPA